MFYVYIIYSEKSDLFYVGFSEDPWGRLFQHNHIEENTFTSKHRPWILKAVFLCGNTRAEAMKLEKEIKKLKSRIHIENLIKPDFIPFGSLAQLVRVPHLRN